MQLAPQPRAHVRGAELLLQEVERGAQGGELRFGAGLTRIGVHDVIGLLQNGETVDTIVSRWFPNLSRAQVYECLAHYEDHRGEIDLLVARQMTAGTT
jgi:uncharacterized protein (DUF433 family)